MPRYRHAYGIILDQPITDRRIIEMYAARTNRTVDQGGLGRFQHYLNFARSMFPGIEWNDWLLTQLKALTTDEYSYKEGSVEIRTVSWAGCGSAGKTFMAGLFSVLFFTLLPKDTAVTLVSTSKIMLRRRVWPIVQQLVSDLSKSDYAYGHMIDSQMMFQAAKGDAKHAIAGVAVQGGELQAALENLKGIHASRILLVIDEASSVPLAIYEAIRNLRKGCQELVVLVVANPISKLDPHGRCCEPAAGWPSIDVSSDMWRTAGVGDWMLPPGACYRFDGFKSPNVRLGVTKYKYLYTCEDHAAALAASAGQQTLKLWSQDRGFWAPTGVLNTIFDETMVEKYGARGKFVWQSVSENIASLDPAFGGDGCIFQAGEYGDLPSGRFGVQLKDFIAIQADPTSKDEVDFQIANRVIKECEKRRIRPENFAMDKTGTGRGVYAILRQTWGDILGVEFGGAPSTKPASSSDPRESCEVYDRRVSELWHSVREFLITEQIKGLYPEAIVQFCSREYTIKARKIVLDTKDECREKIGRSPDHADAIAVLVELARSKGAVAGNYMKQSDRWDEYAKKFDAVYDSDIANNDPIEDEEVYR